MRHRKPICTRDLRHWMRWSRLRVLLMSLVLGSCGIPPASAEEPGHPRLYMTAEDLPKLRAAREQGVHKKIWENLQESAEWCLTLTPRQEWIAPVSPDPIYENLYDRFYAIMHDMAVMEHLAFAYALSGDERYGEGARDWVLANCRAWKPETDGAVDGGKAYAVCRLLKGLAVGYDLAYDRLSEAQRKEVQAAITRISRKYYADYFTTPRIAGPGFHTHHATVEWSSFGVAALVLLGEVPEAKNWLDATVVKFDEHLLPTGLAPDGAQTEGATFWASTMQYRLFFMDALRRVTGRDLFEKHERFMNADPVLAAVATEKWPGYSRIHENVVLEPSYGQLDYCSSVLLGLARAYRRPTCQYLALWDHSMGQIQKTRYVTPTRKIEMLFHMGGYAYVWYDPRVPAKPEEKRLSFHFRSVGKAYARRCWEPGDLLAAVGSDHGLAVHAGGHPVLLELGTGRHHADTWSPLPVRSLEDNGKVAVITCEKDKKHSMTIELDRPQRQVLIRRSVPGDWTCWCQGKPTREGNTVTWSDRVRMTVESGTVTSWDPTGYSPKIVVGLTLLHLPDPFPQKYPLLTITPSDEGQIVVSIRLSKENPELAITPTE